ncbi:VOC family protein [Maribacter sp. ANRC-HE7]|uniref:VOC family protein n=1 Tax=Maribacter aquimaris TaxID=2737171 RepID=A0ABR7V3F5_9FLAO|nr:VOC family protein [Maribacter aquimaris]MBD0777707.1 VOC family protein [Maribacter aquimaris]
MNQIIANITLIVEDYDKALTFYTQKLGFKLRQDIPLEGDKRWVLVSPAGAAGTALLLAKADTDKEKERIGDQTGGRVLLFLHTDDFWRDYKRMKAKGVVFNEAPREEPYGTVAVFQDLYGNLWDLLQPKG